MKVKDLVISTELFPQPFHISRGSFRFDQDKMWFDAFNASYGKTSLTLNGWLSNVIGYMTDRRAVLKGSFDLNSDYILADEFMQLSHHRPPPSRSHPTPSGQTGVILVPGNLSISFNAAAKKIKYNGIELDSFKGQMVVDSGKILLNKTRLYPYRRPRGNGCDV